MNQPGEEWDEDVRKPRNRVGGELNKIHSPTRVERKKFFEYCAEYWTAHLDDQTVVSNESLLESEHDAVVRLLLEKGAAVDLIDKSGWSGFQLRVPDRATYLLYHDNTADITTDKLLPPGFESHQYQHWVRK
ncbi:hypothetical protein H2198_006988 [Neophaeococcomyces mojaviensis]|uniref:Uncharacterized protein n=1 Tax=Neophaeococcomyces mojaviensis TaxID=3383035 RepID=A0ACC3A1C4_9EURO|nr:hypothetical protein H2198_006988 [Knufia sp. JES_112]